MPPLPSRVPTPQEHSGVCYLVIFPTDCLQGACVSIIFSDALPPLKGSAVEGTAHRLHNDRHCRTLVSLQNQTTVPVPSHPGGTLSATTRELGSGRAFGREKVKQEEQPKLPEKSATALRAKPTGRHVSQPPPPSPRACKPPRSPPRLLTKGEQERDLLQAQQQDAGHQGIQGAKTSQGTGWMLPPP